MLAHVSGAHGYFFMLVHSAKGYSQTLKPYKHKRFFPAVYICEGVYCRCVPCFCFFVAIVLHSMLFGKTCCRGSDSSAIASSLLFTFSWPSELGDE